MDVASVERSLALTIVVVYGTVEVNNKENEC